MAERLRLSWKAVDGIMRRAVHRGLSRREHISPRRMSVDETAYRKGHDYITVVTDQEQDAVIHVAEDQRIDSLAGFYETRSRQQEGTD